MLHVLVGHSCNNNCLFCMEADRDARGKHMGRQSGDDIRRMIANYPDTDEILFTSGEPTLCAQLPAYVALAKERGFHVIGVISNGRRLAYPQFAEHLVACGVNRITISIHGHTSRLHDGLTRCPGSFRQTHAGLSNCAGIKKRSNLRLHASTVITQRNLPHVAAIHAMLRTFDVDEMIFNVMMAKGRGAEHFDALMPRYEHVVSGFCRLHETLGDDARHRVRVVDMPLCVMRKLPPGMAGELEEFDQYEPTGSTGVSGFEVLNPASEPEARVVGHRLRGRARALSEQSERGGAFGLVHAARHRAVTALCRMRRPGASVTLEALRSGSADAIATLRRTVSEPAFEGGRPYYVSHRSLKDQFLRVKGPPCERCNARNTCPGVWEIYVERYGWSEIVAI